MHEIRNELNDSLGDLIEGLYEHREIHCLADTPTPRVVETARAHLDEFADSSLDFVIARNLLIQRGRSVGTLRSDQVTIERLPTDLSASMSPEELVDVVETNRADLQAGLAMYSDKLLSLAVHRVSAYGQRHSIGTKQVAHEISQVIANERWPRACLTQ